MAKRLLAFSCFFLNRLAVKPSRLPYAVALGLKPEWFEIPTLFDIFNSPRPPGETLSQGSLHERVEIPIKLVGRRPRGVPGAKVFQHLIGLEHVRAYLVSPTDIRLGRSVRVGLLFARLELP